MVKKLQMPSLESILMTSREICLLPLLQVNIFTIKINKQINNRTTWIRTKETKAFKDSQAVKLQEIRLM